MLALIDGDVLVYRCGFAAEKNKYTATTEDGEFILSCQSKKELNTHIKDIDNVIITKETIPEALANATYNIKHSLDTIAHACRAKHIKVFISGENNFREDVATIRPYKGNRDKNNRPYHYNALRKYILNNYPSELVEGQEADDAMGIEQVKWILPGEVYASTIICTIDKDLNMIPGWHYNWVTDKKEFIDEYNALRFFYTQLITGDTTDNIVGIHGKGVAAANKILQGLSTEEEYIRAVALQYAIAYEDPEAALIENARLLWIRREENELWKIPELK